MLFSAIGTLGTCLKDTDSIDEICILGTGRWTSDTLFCLGIVPGPFMSALRGSGGGTFLSIESSALRTFRLSVGNAPLGLDIEDISLLAPGIVVADAIWTKSGRTFGALRHYSAYTVLVVPYKVVRTLGRPWWNTAVCCSTIPVIPGTFRRLVGNALSVTDHAALRARWEGG
jgi:hypothetical protein